ncbi:MAG: hypothetical protein M5U08_08015 [Burkholderiales bacterium]|nr:hypothetical protein [Burkholderiales bacterium]
MATRQPLTQFVESYRFWDVVTLWARERLEHEDIVAGALARGVVCDGLKLQSVDEVNDRAVEGSSARDREPGRRERLSEEFLLRKDFRDWLLGLDLRLPTFWFGAFDATSDRLRR